MRALLLTACLALLLPACVLQPTMPVAANGPRSPPPEVSPFDEAPAVYPLGGQHFAPVDIAIVRVCLSDDLQVESAVLLHSSGDRRFDQAAQQWARQVRIRESHPAGTVVQRCGEVHVEIRRVEGPRPAAGPSSVLG